MLSLSLFMGIFSLLLSVILFRFHDGYLVAYCLAFRCFYYFFTGFFFPLSENMFDTNSIFLNWPILCDPRYALSWIMFCMHLRKKGFLLLLCGMSNKYQLSLSGLMCHLWLIFPYNFLSGWAVHWCKWGVNISHCHCVTDNFLFYDC